jgi:hypothetical protein
MGLAAMPGIDLVRKPNHTPPFSTSDLCNCDEVFAR